MSGIRIVDLEDIASAREVWTRLAQRSANPFMSWEWADVWLRHFGGSGSLHLLACEDLDGRVVGLLPLHEATRGPFRLFHFIGHGPADRLGPLCEPDDRIEVAEAFVRWLESRPANTLFLGDYLVGKEGWSDRLDGTILAVSSSPSIEFPEGGWEAFLSDRSANFRSQARGRKRRLERKYDVEFLLTVGQDELDRRFEELIRLHDNRWGDGGSAVFDARGIGFHRDFCRVALEKGWLRLWTLYLDDRATASWYGLRYGNRDWYYQSGRDRSFDGDSVGFVLLVHTIQDAADHGQTGYELLRGGEAYKDRFAVCDPGLETIGLGAGVPGRVAMRLASTLSRSPRGRRVLSSFLRREGQEVLPVDS